MPNAVITIKHGKEKAIQNRHPWVFSGAIQSVTGNPAPADVVCVQTHDGQLLGYGTYNATSQIRVRMLTWQDEAITPDWWRGKLQQAITARAGDQAQWRNGTPNAVRLINAENDYLPGLVVDRYGDWLVLQALTLGIDARKQEIAATLAELLQPAGIYERSDVDIRQKEGLREVKGLLWGQEPPDTIEIIENGLSFPVDVRHGHKTGFYLDQRENRATVRRALESIAARRVLNMFSYTGGFGVYALAGGANDVINVDSSGPALALAEATVKLNGLDPDAATFIEGDAFTVLRDYAAHGEQFDAIILDPPKFAQSEKQVERATRGYKDLNLHAFKLLKPGGLLFTFSCSGAITTDLFQKVVFGALADSGRQAQIVRHLGGSEDHPVALTFPEGAYLKGLMCRVV
ncbi:MAG: class I SAM-dependent rRNA methyltransferase [Phototrophicaceae bacterium]